ncbi:ORF3 [red squirrel adenovirus 1]|uniref:ORF3 n=1 Tax=red squirrel adenovirus 1 TaxID=2773314 RepID=A0A240FBF9_9ADEN|nr:ORF3 [red squirrel adenovirus 1]ARE31879.1 ORF3 [red squirrel adenovirus 1]
MSANFLDKSAIWFTNAWKGSVINCSFDNFNGSALWFRDDNLYGTSNWQQQHLITACRFRKCRIGISNSGRAEYSVATMNMFFDCHVCFNVIGGNWRRSENQMVICKCAYLHVEAGMWYEGNNKENPAHDAFTGNTLNHGDSGCLWPAAFTLADGRQITRLAGFYFDSSLTFPPTFSNNVLWYTGIDLKGFSTGSSLKTFCFTGCTFMGNAGNNTQSRLAIGRENQTNNSKVYFIGCSGNNIALYNVEASHVVPSFGTLMTLNHDSDYPNGRAGGDDQMMQ